MLTIFPMSQALYKFRFSMHIYWQSVSGVLTGWDVLWHPGKTSTFP